MYLQKLFAYKRYFPKTPCPAKWGAEEKRGKGKEVKFARGCAQSSIAELVGVLSVPRLKRRLFHGAPGNGEENCLGLTLGALPSCQAHTWKIRDVQNLPPRFSRKTLLRGQDEICKAKLERAGSLTPFLVCLLGFGEERASFVSCK